MSKNPNEAITLHNRAVIREYLDKNQGLAKNVNPQNAARQSK